MAEVRSIIAHFTAGWPRRDAANEFVGRYIEPNHERRGIGPQFYISQDGTVARLIDVDVPDVAMPLQTGHGEFANGWALGVETGNLGEVAAPPAAVFGPSRIPVWIAASADAEDIPRAKLWITHDLSWHPELVPAWWTTADYAGPGRGRIGAGHMLFSESEYSSWALLARYLLEDFQLPRNFPLLPHVTRSGMMSDSVSFRRIVLADERAEMMMRAFAAPPINIPDASFEPANKDDLKDRYGHAVAPAGGGVKQHNRAWRAFFDLYRGLHGHAFAGSLLTVNNDHDCPGPLFDFHRLAREVWDWWWYPFDRVAVGPNSPQPAGDDGATSAVEPRPYRNFRADTALVEYYFDEPEGARARRIAAGIHGPGSSPNTFALEPASPIYAMANGELVAARFPTPGPAPVSLGFALVRHEVYHEPFVTPFVQFPSIDYDRPPSTVYTLYMHLERPAGMSFERVSDDNPDWLNRLLIRKKECDLGVQFYDGDPADHHGIPDAVWNSRPPSPPGVPRRPTTLEGWRADQELLTGLRDTLRRGEVAVVTRPDSTRPIRVLLGDFLGKSGVTRVQDGQLRHGIRVEVFAPSFVAPTFSLLANRTEWTFDPTLPGPPCIQYPSEWAAPLGAAERAAMVAIGVDPALVRWWGAVAAAQSLDRFLPADARLPVVGAVFHYQPLDFLRWINTVTWASEWPKYEVVDDRGRPVPTPARPRSRRV